MAIAAARSKTKRLQPGATETVLRGQGECDAWRTLHIAADRPVEVELLWGSVAGQLDPAKVTVSRAEMLCVWAAWWQVNVTNLDASNEARVRAVVVDQHRSLSPVFEQRKPSAHPTAATHDVPAWAAEVRLDTADQALLAATIELLDVDDQVRASITQTRLPSWLPLGSAASVRVTCEAPYRLVWRLHLL